MKIALHVSKMNNGGAERTMANIANYMASNGHEVIMVNAAIRPDDYYLDSRVKRLISEPTDNELSGGRIHNFMARYNRLKDIWVTENPDVIFSYLGKTNIMTILTARKTNAAVAVGVVGTPGEEYYNPVLKYMARHLFKKADKIVLQTKASEAFFPEAIINKSVIMKNPMTPEFDIDMYEGERDKTIISVGRIDENKNHELLVNAFANIADKYPDYRVIIYGDGPLRETLIGKVDKMGLSRQIVFPGRISNVADVIKKAGVFVLTSNTEGSPNALIEAMMLGLPVISTDCPCGGPAELIDDGVNGLLIPVGDVAKMQDCLQKLIDNLQYASELGRKASKTRDIYSPKIVMKEWEDLFISLENNKKK